MDRSGVLQGSEGSKNHSLREGDVATGDGEVSGTRRIYIQMQPDADPQQTWEKFPRKERMEMKKIRKITALLLAAVLIVAMAVPALATEPVEPSTPTTYNITVNTDNDNYTHTYKVYQIFTGTPSDGKLVDVQYGSSYPGGLTGAVPKDTLDTITDARAWAAANKNNLGTEVATLDGTTTSYAAVPGWYLVLDTAYTDDTTDDKADAYSAFMVKVVDQATEFTPKKEVPSVDKSVTGGSGDAIQTEIGKEMTFTLTATIPADANLAAYDEYLVKFKDTMSAGLTFVSLDSVTVNGTAIEAGEFGAKDGTYYTTVAEGATGAWNLEIADVKKAVEDFKAGVTVVVTYKAVLNSNAVTSQESVAETTEAGNNNNKVTVEYSNNPDATGEGTTAETPDDHVWVFTFESDNTKVDKNDQPVPGAGFEIQKNGTALQLYKVGTTYYVYNANAPEGTYPTGGTIVTEMMTTADGNAFDIKGLEAGTYTLHEKTVPEGYVQAEDITITITATVSEGATDLGKLEMTSTNLNNKVVNLTGTTLPSTGGMGTTVLYVIGAIIIVGAGVLLITRRRANAAK